MKGYKGFNENLQCRGFQYEIGKEYTEDGAELCNHGFHACEMPIDVFRYYPPGLNSRYCEVELDANNEKETFDSKRVGKTIKIGAEIGIPGIVKAQIEYVKACTEEAIKKGDGEAATAGENGAATAGENGAATAGNYGAATAGENGAATAGNYGAATAGNYGAATAGENGAATAGDYGAATAGENGAATAGDYGAATAGYKGAATAGDYGAATSRGSSATGKNGLSVARGNDVKVKGGIGAILVIAEENNHDFDVKEWAATVVDGEKIKADTWYKLKDGEFVEAEEQEGE